MIGERLKYARMRSRKTLDSIAKECGVSRQAINLWERNRRTPKGDRFDALCRHLNVSPEWMLGMVPLEPEPTPKPPKPETPKRSKQLYTLKEAIEQLQELGFEVYPPGL